MGTVHGGIEYLTRAETAILVRRVLRERWAQVKFSVRSDTYSGGASIDVSWFDGLRELAAEAWVRQFKGREVRRMIDLKAPARSVRTEDEREQAIHPVVHRRGLQASISKPIIANP